MRISHIDKCETAEALVSVKTELKHPAHFSLFIIIVIRPQSSDLQLSQADCTLRCNLCSILIQTDDLIGRICNTVRCLKLCSHSDKHETVFVWAGCCGAVAIVFWGGGAWSTMWKKLEINSTHCETPVTPRRDGHGHFPFHLLFHCGQRRPQCTLQAEAKYFSQRYHYFW